MSVLNVTTIQHESGSGNNIVLDSDGNVVCAADVQMASLNGGQIGFRNQIVNGSLLVWARGTSSDTVGYGADRMYFANAGTDGNNERDTNAPAESGLQFTYAINPGAILVNSVEVPQNGAPFINGSQWTFSFYSRLDIRETSDNEIQFATGNASASDAESLASGFTWEKEVLPSTWRRYSYTFTVDSDPNAGNNCMRLWFRNAGDRNSVTGFQLEPGSIATSFEHRPIGLEQMLSSRYYQVLPTQYKTIRGSNGTSVFADGAVPLVATMRATPTCTFERIEAGSDLVNAPVIDANLTNRYGIVVRYDGSGDSGQTLAFQGRADAEL